MGSIAESAETGRYLGDEVYDYPVCFHCIRWSPFLIYLEDNNQVQKFRPFEKGMQLYCPNCVPKQDEFQRKFPGERLYRENSILHDRQLMALLGQFQYEHPTKQGFADLDRIIITENAKLHPYKDLAKKSLPLRRKAVLLMDLFPTMHRMANRKFPSFRKMCSAVRAKASRIVEGYMDMSETEHSQLQDNFDVLIDRTPMHMKMSSQQQQRSLMPPPVAPARPVLNVLEEPAAYVTVSSLGDVSMASSDSIIDALRMDPGSEDEANQSSGESSLALSSQEPSSQANAIRPQSSQSGIHLSTQDVSILGASRINLDGDQGRASTQTSSQSLQLSSQDISDPNASHLLPSNSLLRISSRVSSTDSDSSTASNASTSRKRSLDLSDAERPASPVPVNSPAPSANDGQLAGPSNKKARNDIPMNPTPAQFVRNPTGRMPRVLGA